MRVLRSANRRSTRRGRPAPRRALLIDRPRAPRLRAIGRLRLPRCRRRLPPGGRPGGHRRLREHAHLARRPPRRLSPGAPPARAAHDLRERRPQRPGGVRHSHRPRTYSPRRACARPSRHLLRTPTTSASAPTPSRSSTPRASRRQRQTPPSCNGGSPPPTPTTARSSSSSDAAYTSAARPAPKPPNSSHNSTRRSAPSPPGAPSCPSASAAATSTPVPALKPQHTRRRLWPLGQPVTSRSTCSLANKLTRAGGQSSRRPPV